MVTDGRVEEWRDGRLQIEIKAFLPAKNRLKFTGGGLRAVPFFSVFWGRMISRTTEAVPPTKGDATSVHGEFEDD
jgi:hypothetical protein